MVTFLSRKLQSSAHTSKRLIQARTVKNPIRRLVRWTVRVHRRRQKGRGSLPVPFNHIWMRKSVTAWLQPTKDAAVLFGLYFQLILTEVKSFEGRPYSWEQVYLSQEPF